MAEQTILHGLFRQEEWRCAWEAVANFRADFPDRYGRDQGEAYTFEGAALGEEITIGVWRSKHGLNAVRVEKE